MKESNAIREIEKKVGRSLPKTDNNHITGYTVDESGNIIGVSISDVNVSTENIRSVFDYLTYLPKLTYLRLHKMDIKEIAKIVQLKSITNLDLSGNKITDITPLNKLENLTHLHLRSNQINNIKPLNSLTRLKDLGLFNNKIEDIRSLEGLINLDRLWLNHNNIENIKPVENLTNLNKLWLDHNIIRNLKPLEKLVNLNKLYVNNNCINNIEAIKGLKELDELYLSNNLISDIRPLEKLVNLQNVDVSANPISTIPPEVIRQGIKAIRAWFAANKKLLNEIKILLVGDHTAGKTSLCKILKDGHGSYQASQNQTDGIVIETFKFGQMETFKAQKRLTDITAYVWDFGGQEILSNTHQFFLTNRSVYALLLEARSDRDADLQVRRWMEKIKSKSGNSPVIVIVNKIELNRAFGFDTTQLSSEYPQIKGFVKISCAENENIDKVKYLLEECIPKAAFFETQIDERWINVKDELQEIAHQRHKLDHNEFVEICQRNDLKDEGEQSQAIHFLHDLGVLLHFDELPLKEYYVLDPYWVTTGVYRIITSNKAGDQKGEIEKADLEEIMNSEPLAKVNDKHQQLPQKKYTASECYFITNIMEHFQLCYFIDGGNKILIPDLLDKDTPIDKTTPFINAVKKLPFIYSYTDYFPSYLMPRFIVAMKDDIKIQWRSGVVLTYAGSNTQALIIANTSKSRIEIIVTGDEEKNKEYMSIIRYNIDHINDKHKLKPRFQVPLPGLKGLAVDYDKLYTLAQRGETHYTEYSQGELYTFVIEDLTNDIYPRAQNEKMAKKLTKTLRIFLASSIELKEERERLESMLSRENNKYFDLNLHIKLTIWEDLGKEMNINGSQVGYIQELQKCDMFIMLYYSKVGKYTLEEFEAAYAQFVKTNRPLIYIYSKERNGDLSKQTREDALSVFDFEDRLNELKHFKASYKNPEDLLLQLRVEIARALEKTEM